MKILCIIPSRIGSTRLPRKALLPIQGKPMVQWVYENAKKCPIINDIIVATDSQDIAEVIQKINGNVVFTPADLATGSDRVAYVAKKLDADIIINLQGDEPFVKASMLKQLVSPYLKGERPLMTTLAYPLLNKDEYANPNIVKVLVDKNQDAIYFSRSPIPYFKNSIEVPVYHHIGLYAFQREFLLNFTSLPQTPLEKAEALEQLRAIEQGYKIRVCLTSESTLEINTPSEYEQAQQFAAHFNQFCHQD